MTASGYPPDWPRCDCGAPVLDGHLTCGRAPCGTQQDAQKRRRLPLVMYLVDGRAIDLSGLTMAQVAAKCEALGITHDDVLETVHVATIPLGRQS